MPMLLTRSHCKKGKRGASRDRSSATERPVNSADFAEVSGRPAVSRSLQPAPRVQIAETLGTHLEPFCTLEKNCDAVAPDSPQGLDYALQYWRPTRGNKSSIEQGMLSMRLFH